MARRGCVPVGESAHGYMLTPLRGEMNWDRNFQRQEVSEAKSDSYFPHETLERLFLNEVSPLIDRQIPILDS